MSGGCGIQHKGRMAAAIATALVLVTVAGCAAGPAGSGDATGPRGESMSMDQLAQTDFNRTVTMAMRDNLDGLYRLQEKLYRRNPGQWRRAGFESLQSALDDGREAIFTGREPPGLGGLKDIEILSVSLDPGWTGDRVGAFIYGLADMILGAHGNKSRFYITDALHAGRIHNAARNVEVAAWLLNTRRDAAGQPLLFANELSDQDRNLSFEREFGQIIGRLDLVANLLDENLRRVGINYMQGLLFFNFLPVR